MKTYIRNKANLPNEHGFSFYAVMPDGHLEPDSVFVNEQGQYRTTHFKDMLGWLRETDNSATLTDIDIILNSKTS